eukprot:TRINITY_DN2119_c0_g1_i1.p1 TRINITY_DN2119_c0_g1~~TRINITY_DN2119_c0_g1_i1.p1  ORF type:complete len:355 (+),score=104.84 TRINITY_DN2119_c0_g1_i1:222-1286(+)
MAQPEKTNSERGYMTCGVLNRTGKPCQRIGVCPFHFTRTSLQVHTSPSSSVITQTIAPPPSEERTIRKSSSAFGLDSMTKKRKLNQIKEEGLESQAEWEQNQVPASITSTTTHQSNFSVQYLTENVKRESSKRDELRKTYPSGKRVAETWGLDEKSQELLKKAAQSKLNQLMREPSDDEEEETNPRQPPPISPIRMVNPIQPSSSPFPHQNHRFCPVHHHRHNHNSSQNSNFPPRILENRNHPPISIPPQSLANYSVPQYPTNYAPPPVPPSPIYSNPIPQNFYQSTFPEPIPLLSPTIPTDNLSIPSPIPLEGAGIMDHPHFLESIPPELGDLSLEPDWLGEIQGLDFDRKGT